MELSDQIPRGNADRPSIEIALDLIYRATQYRIPASKITFGIPKAVDLRIDIKQDENTFVPVELAEVFDARFAGDGEEGFLYRRIPLSLLTQDETVALTLPPYPFEAHDILDDINAKFHTQFTEQDIENTRYVDSSVPFEITASPHSLVWLGKVGFTPSEAVMPDNARLLENADYRVTENNEIRVLETV